jgi:hypothetical protein
MAQQGGKKNMLEHSNRTSSSGLDPTCVKEPEIRFSANRPSDTQVTPNREKQNRLGIYTHNKKEKK